MYVNKFFWRNTPACKVCFPGDEEADPGAYNQNFRGKKQKAGCQQLGFFSPAIWTHLAITKTGFPDSTFNRPSAEAAWGRSILHWTHRMTIKPASLRRSS